MPTHVILLRGVMPRGRNKVPMSPLRAALETAGLTRVRTYIQSGNLLADSRLAQRNVERRVHDTITREFGGDIAVFARSPAWLAQVLQQIPFAGADPAKLYFTVLSETPHADRLQSLMAIDHGADRLEVVGDVAYLLCATHYRDTRLNNNTIERRLGVSATTRNFSTMSSLHRLAQA